MAKKKRKHRNPVAPRVHSSPATTHGPVAPPPAPGPTGPEGVQPPLTELAPEAAPPRPRPKKPMSRQAAKRRRSRRRTYLILGGVVVLLFGAIIGNQVINSRKTSALNALGAAAGCAEVETTGDSGAGEHLAEGDTATYDTSPPSHGEHAASTLSAGVYEEPLSTEPTEATTIYRAVHSLEHGAIVVWHDGLSEEDQQALERRYRNEEKVIVAPYADLEDDDHVAMTAWGRLMTCEESSTRVIDAFVEQFRGARSAPEPNNQI